MGGIGPRWLSTAALSTAAALAASSSCDFQRLSGKQADEAVGRHAARPVVLTGLLDSWPARQKWASAAAFAELYGELPGYARDHDQLELRDVDTTVRTYLQGTGGASTVSSLKVNLSSSSSFFVNDYEDSRLLDALGGDFHTPLLLGDVSAVRVFALEQPYAGVAFHRHEAAWQGLLAGQKEWFLLAPSVEEVPQHSPCSFVREAAPPLAQRCTLNAGEVIFVPSGWWHATCSLPTEPTIAIGGVGSSQAWPPSVLAARHGQVHEADGDVDGAQVPSVSPSVGGIFVGGERPLFVAAAFGQEAAVEALLKRGADPNLARADGRTALHEAARRGDLLVVQSLVQAKGDLSLADKGGSQVLHHACAERARLDVVEYLLGQGARASAQRTDDGREPLHVACRAHTDPVPVLRALVKSGQVQPSPRDRRGMTPLMHCATAGHGRGVGLLLRFGTDEDALRRDNSGVDALGHALLGRGDVGAVERLLAAGLSPEGRLVDAARLGDPDLVKLLAKAGAQTDGAMLAAARSGHAGNIRMLVQLGATTTEQEQETEATPVHLAAMFGHLGALRALLQWRADPGALDADNLTAMHYAATTAGRVPPRRQQDIIEALLDAGGKSLGSQRGARGFTPLHLAAASGDAMLVRWLVLEKQIDPGAKDEGGDTPARAAVQANHTELADLLRGWEKTWNTGKDMEL
ncbi:unnamed protein product [Polarella glacialis]|uniref:JmjC domain-containing protein n=1 Tax=Polarella glacialis TaxID=89957 RepID=A0A813E2L7_POLGL|nr:unnamed protein product [Polarella glacialis]